MTIKISQLANLTVVQANTIIPVVSSISGTPSTLRSNVQQLQDYIIAGVSSDITVLYTNAATQSDLINGINANVSAANVGVVGYVDQANLAMKGYVDNVSTSQNIANVNMKSYVDGQITAANTGVTSANTGLKGYVDQANTIQSSQIASANVGIIGYINLSNTTTKSYVDGQITAANANVATANIGMKGYVDSQSYYSNAKVTTFFTAIANVNSIVVANVTSGPVSLSPGGAGNVLTSNGNNWVSGGTYIRLTATTFSTLPAANIAGAGAKAFITDANTTTFGAAVTGGSTNSIPIFSNGSAWRVG